LVIPLLAPYFTYVDLSLTLFVHLLS